MCDSCSSSDQEIEQIPDDHYICGKYRSLLHRIFIEQNQSYHEMRETMDEQVFQRVTDLLAPLGMVVDEMDQDASLCASFIWHSALRRLGRVPKMVRGQNLYESPPSEQLQKAIQNTKWRYLQTDHKLHWPETCSILTCRRSSIFAMEGLP